MNDTVSLAEIRSLPAQVAQRSHVTVPGFGDAAAFDLLQRAAKLLSASELVPKIYRGPDGIASCAIVLNMALRMKADPLMVAQNLYVVHGRPAWSAQFLIACFNQCGRFSALRYRWQGEQGKDEWGARAFSTELATGHEIVGPLVTIDLAKKEGWFGREGSKWKTIPELMITYRAAAWMIRTHAPELAMGLPTTDEASDIIDITPESYSVDRVGAGEHVRARADAPEPTGSAGATTSTATGEVTGKANSDLAGGFTYPQVAAAIKEATSTDALDLAADMIRSVTDERQRAELDVELRAKRKHIAKE